MFYFVKPKELQLKPPQIEINYLPNNQVAIISKTLLKNFYLEDSDAFFEENFIDILPNETKIIQVSKLVHKLKWKCLNEVK